MKSAVTLKSAIEQDDLETGKYMVVIRDSANEIIGIPLRGVGKKVAERSLLSLEYAFEYGYAFAEQEFTRMANNISIPPWDREQR